MFQNLVAVSFCFSFFLPISIPISRVCIWFVAVSISVYFFPISSPTILSYGFPFLRLVVLVRSPRFSYSVFAFPRKFERTGLVTSLDRKMLRFSPGFGCTVFILPALRDNAPSRIVRSPTHFGTSLSLSRLALGGLSSPEYITER